MDSSPKNKCNIISFRKKNFMKFHTLAIDTTSKFMVKDALFPFSFANAKPRKGEEMV